MKKAQDYIKKPIGEAIKEAEQILIKNNTEKKYVVLYDTFYNHKGLTGGEYALFVYLLTRTPNFKPCKRGLMTCLQMSERAILKASKGLQEKGFLTIENKGQGASTWTITQTPIKAYQTKDLRLDDILLSMNPQAIEEKRANGTISDEQAKEQLTIYISALKSKWFSDEEDYEKHVREIIKTKWVN